VAPGAVRARILHIGDDEAATGSIRALLAPFHDVEHTTVASALDRLAGDSDFDAVLLHAGPGPVEALHRNIASAAPHLAARLLLVSDGALPGDVEHLAVMRRIRVVRAPLSREGLCEAIEHMSF
jgi:hypothetical protein